MYWMRRLDLKKRGKRNNNKWRGQTWRHKKDRTQEMKWVDTLRGRVRVLVSSSPELTETSDTHVVQFYTSYEDRCEVNLTIANMTNLFLWTWIASGGVCRAVVKSARLLELSVAADVVHTSACDCRGGPRSVRDVGASRSSSCVCVFHVWMSKTSRVDHPNVRQSSGTSKGSVRSVMERSFTNGERWVLTLEESMFLRNRLISSSTTNRVGWRVTRG